MKYLIGKILLDDQDQEDDIVVFDTTQTVNQFYDFPPLQKSAGDERLTVANTLDIKKCIDTYGPFDVVVVDTNIIDQVQQLIETYSRVAADNVPKMLVISSWEVYGWKGRRRLPISEEEKLEGETPTAMTKREIEKMMSYAFGNQCTIFRLATIFGPYMDEDTEIMQWLMNLILSRQIVVAQPAARKLDLCYVYNVLEPLQRAMTAFELPPIINIGSADSDFKENGKINVFEKNVVEALMGIRVMIDSHSPIAASNEDPTKFQGQGFHSQLMTKLARDNLGYFPIVDTLKGFLQTCHWLQKRMELDPQFSGLMGRSIEEIYPTLDEKKVYKVGEEFKSVEREIEKEISKEEADKIIKERNKPGQIARSEADQVLICPKCLHVPSSIPDGCKCDCHSLYREVDDVG